jgi:hypothetical protein
MCAVYREEVNKDLFIYVAVLLRIINFSETTSCAEDFWAACSVMECPLILFESHLTDSVNESLLS